MEPVEYRAMNPDGKAMIKAAEYLPAHERPSGRFPFALITGRTLYHFHTRTKTGRVRQLRAAAPEPWVEISAADAADLGVTEGDLLEVASARGAIRARARVSRIRPGVLFVPFHYGYWDAENQGRDRAANEITVTDWDPVSKQPLFKTSAAAVRVLAAGLGPAAAPTTTASAPLDRSVPPTRGGADAMADSTTTTRSPR